MPEKVLEDCPRSPRHHLEVASRKHRNGKQHYFVLCKNCYMRGPRKKTPQEAVEAWNALPRALQWTKESPRKPGWYLWRDAPRITIRLQKLDESNIDFYAEYGGGEWAGPILTQEERSA